MKLAVKNELCSGCRACELICALSQQGENNPHLAALNIVPHFPVPGNYEIRFCDQCGDCADVCPFEAIHDENGVYTINEEECTGCGLCIDACPNGVLIMPEDYTVPIKCSNCGDCVLVCPREAIYDAEVLSAEGAL